MREGMKFCPFQLRDFKLCYIAYNCLHPRYCYVVFVMSACNILHIPSPLHPFKAYHKSKFSASSL